MLPSEIASQTHANLRDDALVAWLANRNDERAQPTDVGDPLPNDSQTDGAIDAAFDGLDLEFGLALSDR